MPGLAVLEGLCPTLVLNAEFDDLRASGEAFSAQLALAGVDVRQVMAAGMLHGFLNTRPDLDPVARALDLMAGTVAAVQAPATELQETSA
jgi:acetyl esterase/lipase